MAKEAKVAEEQVVKPVPPIRWENTVDSGWHISNEVFRRVAHTGEFSPDKKAPESKPASKPAPAPSAA